MEHEFYSEYEEEQTPRYRPDSLASLFRATRFTETELKKIYRSFKAECPTGVVREDTFKCIYSQFFPQGENGVTYEVLRTGMTKNVACDLIPNVIQRVKIMNARKNQFKLHTLFDQTAKESSDEFVTEQENLQPLVRQDAFLSKNGMELELLDIGEILKSDSIKGAIICEMSHDKLLTPHQRAVVIDIVVREAMKHCPRLKNEDFMRIENKILSYLKAEPPGLYYKPPVKQTKFQKSKASGGLMSTKYRNLVAIKNELKKCLSESQQNLNETITKKAVNDDEINEMKCWLFHNIEPWDKVTLYWMKCKDSRSHELREKRLSVDDYINNWPILKHPNAYKLIKEDFCSMQLTNVCLNTTVWDKFIHDLQQVFSIAPKDKEGLSLFRRLNTADLNEDSRVAIEFLLLAHFIPPKKKVKRNWKPSIAECKDSLLIHTKISGDLRNIFEKRQKVLQIRKVQLQPFLIVVGPELTAIEEKYLCMGGIFYKLSTTLEAIDVLFQLFHSLDINFPLESTFIWQILEEGIYGIKSQNIETNAAGVLLSLKYW
ncbi:hypothetical protein PV328_004024 [Microctonus aethiopoides]|uniref:Uncharacterized protein n=1 Tax=Microctonus aethiopoides TaxID=144406 RepID=A0AA39F9N0_9HYME|nr:hypothetical protein PV328_004024 [Microctonus aethiopoides]